MLQAGLPYLLYMLSSQESPDLYQENYHSKGERDCLTVTKVGMIINFENKSHMSIKNVYAEVSK
jgi:hypothetical protein